MKRLMGVLCCVAFILTSAACLVGQTSVHQTEVPQGITNTCEDASKAWPKDPKRDEAHATSLEIIWQEGCPPCRRIKVVAIRLIAEGYDIILTNVKDDSRGARRTPTLRYYLPNGGMIREEVGFKTADHIKKYLRK